MLLKTHISVRSACRRSFSGGTAPSVLPIKRISTNISQLLLHSKITAEALCCLIIGLKVQRTEIFVEKFVPIRKKVQRTEIFLFNSSV